MVFPGNTLSNSYMKEDHRSYRRNFCSCEKTVRHSNPRPLRYLRSALPVIIILSRVYNEPIQRPAPSWLVSSIGRALHRYRRGQGFESRTSLDFFSGFLFATAKVTSITAMVFFRISNSLPCSSHKWFSYIHNFKLSNTCEQKIKMVRRVWNSLCATTKSLDFHRKESGCRKLRKPCMICTCPSFKMTAAGSLNPMVLCANYIIFSLESSAPTFCWPDIYFTVAFSLPPRNF